MNFIKRIFKNIKNKIALEECNCPGNKRIVSVDRKNGITDIALCRKCILKELAQGNLIIL